MNYTYTALTVWRKVQLYSKYFISFFVSHAPTSTIVHKFSAPSPPPSSPKGPILRSLFTSSPLYLVIAQVHERTENRWKNSFPSFPFSRSVVVLKNLNQQLTGKKAIGSRLSVNHGWKRSDARTQGVLQKVPSNSYLP